MILKLRIPFFIIAFIAAVVPASASQLTHRNKYSHENSRNDLIMDQRLKKGHDGCNLPLYFPCLNGACVDSTRTCDGAMDCPDGSDETYHLCKNIICPKGSFQCAYGACVGNAAVCNGIPDCADNSDELYPGCAERKYVEINNFICDNDDLIDKVSRCDGRVDCRDGSDETLDACAETSCPRGLFQCGYGACVDPTTLCDGIDDCADGSDEGDMLCRPEVPPDVLPEVPPEATLEVPPKVPRTTTFVTSIPPTPSMCVIPKHPEHGWLQVKGRHSKRLLPGMITDVVYLNAGCEPGYQLLGNPLIFCYYGIWSAAVDQFPTCVRVCKVEESISVKYLCLVKANGNSRATRDCEEWEPEGTVMLPQCRSPHYFSRTGLPDMDCVGGQWNYSPICQPDCRKGRGPDPLIAGGEDVQDGDAPWQAAVYRKVGDSRVFQCGGTLIGPNAIKTAAHCFGRDSQGQIDASQYVVSVGNIHRDFGHPLDAEYTQTSDVINVYLPESFDFSSRYYQNDIALVILTTPVVYNFRVCPVNLDLSGNIVNDLQGVMGMMAGWGETDKRGSKADILQKAYFPIRTLEECTKLTSPHNDMNTFVGNKICAGYSNGTALCKGDSGGGLVLRVQVEGGLQPYLVGVTSTSPTNYYSMGCNFDCCTGFEPVSKHIKLITDHFRDGLFF